MRRPRLNARGREAYGYLIVFGAAAIIATRLAELRDLARFAIHSAAELVPKPEPEEL